MGKQSLRDYYGMSREELYQIVDATHSDPDDTLQYVIDDQTVFDRAAHLDIPSEAVTDSAGRTRSFHTIKSPIFEDDEVVQTVGVSRLLNDTDLQRREIDHHDAKAFVAPLRALTQSFPNPMLMVDVKNRILNSNRLWSRAFGDPGASPNSFLEDRYGEFPEMLTAIEECLCYRRDMQFAVHVGADDETQRRYSLAASPWSFSDGALGGATVIATDISELYHRTEALQRANDELMQFSYRASHDLKGPLSTIKGLAGFIADDIRDGDTDEALTSALQITETAKRLEHTVTSILELARADLKDNPVESFDLTAMIDAIRDDLDQRFVQADVRMLTDCQVQQLTSQPVRVRQILENLISNAVKYHDQTRTDRFVKVSTQRVSEGVEVMVSDNGIGVPEDAKSAIFELFSRFETKREGAGLGLSIVDKHVKALSGKIEVESGAEGTAFRVVLPHAIEDRLAS